MKVQTGAAGSNVDVRCRCKRGGSRLVQVATVRGGPARCSDAIQMRGGCSLLLQELALLLLHLRASAAEMAVISGA